MKVLILICLFALAVAHPDEKYTDKYDNIDVNELLTNKRLLMAYMGCMMETGKCAADAKLLKESVGDALETGCEKCTEIQKVKAKQIIGHLINEEPGYWEQLTGKYDPKKVYTVRYEEELRKIKHS